MPCRDLFLAKLIFNLLHFSDYRSLTLSASELPHPAQVKLPHPAKVIFIILGVKGIAFDIQFKYFKWEMKCKTPTRES